MHVVHVVHPVHVIVDTPKLIADISLYKRGKR
jgi:hypothetical protein